MSCFSVVAVVFPRRREQEERIHKMAALKKQATART